MKNCAWERAGILSKMSDLQMPRQNLRLPPVRIWHKEGKAGVALQASLLVVDESNQRPALSDCFGENDL